jgi:predicted alpha-1,2-mannosidase
MKNKLLFIILLIISGTKIYAQLNSDDLTQYVNPFIGTANNGNTFPGAVVPWGMVSVSPHNSPGSPSGYIHGEKFFYGFGHVHLSGTGCADLGSIVIIPSQGEIQTNPEKYRSTYSSEKAHPGYYRIILDDLGVESEVTAKSRSSIIRFNVQEERKVNILIDVGRSLNLNGGGAIILESETKVSGKNIAGGFCGEMNRQTVYFSSEVNLVPESRGIWIGDSLISNNYGNVTDSSIGCWLTFRIKPDKPLLIKTGISYVSDRNARENVEAEIADWNFDLIREKATNAWQKELTRITVEGGTVSDRVKFYTALYHMLIHPNVINDVNGDYPLMGRTGIGRYEKGNRYSIFSLWDTYRTLHPFLTLIYPEQQSEMMQTMVDMYKESGWFPKWELAGNETYMMVGDPGTIVIADSYLKGIRDFDIKTAFEGILKSADLKPGEKAPPVRAGYHEQLKYGYIPVDQDTTEEWWVWGPVSTTLEYCLADWSINRLANKFANNDLSAKFLDRSHYYKNIFDHQTRFLRPKLKDGSWLTPFDSQVTEGSGSWEGSGGPGYVEGNAWNYTWFVPHDIPGLIRLFGSEDEFAKKLEEAFHNSQFTINNEPDIAYPYLFTYIDGKEFLTAELVSKIIQTEFGTRPNGLPGNDDCGTISGWLAFSMLGFYPACPAADTYQLGIPVFEKAIIQLNRDYFPSYQFLIKKHQENANSTKIRKILLNDSPINNFQLKHADIVNGGELVFEIE